MSVTVGGSCWLSPTRTSCCAPKSSGTRLVGSVACVASSITTREKVRQPSDSEPAPMRVVQMTSADARMSSFIRSSHCRTVAQPERSVPLAAESSAPLRKGRSFCSRASRARSSPLAPRSACASSLAVSVASRSRFETRAGCPSRTPRTPSLSKPSSSWSTAAFESAHASSGPPPPPASTLRGVDSFEWVDGGEALAYTECDGRGRPARALLHTIGSHHTEDVLLVEEEEESCSLCLSTTKDGAWLAISSHSRDSSEVRLLPAAEARGATPRLVAPREAGVHYFVEGLAPNCLLVTSRSARAGGGRGGGGSGGGRGAGDGGSSAGGSVGGSDGGGAAGGSSGSSSGAS
mmetsp:Transcript_21319/g.66818  ORF Transcript_21319/g.66818 Transcript_21319/m.66818 type:complete len:348 (-) Transcript_21319:179-1222(-)